MDNSQRIPLSPAQERLWAADRMTEQKSGYQISRSFWLDGDLDVDALEHAIRAVAGRQEMLRSRIASRDGLPGVEFDAPEALRVERVDLRDAPDARHCALRIATEHTDRPGDLAAGPLLRPLVVLVADRCFFFHYAVHHIVFDGPSRVIFERELGAAYRCIVAGRTPAASPLPMRYADHAAAQRETLAGDGAADQLAYWVDALCDAPKALEWFADLPRPAKLSGAAAQVPVLIDSGTCHWLRRLAAAERTSLFVVCLAAYQFLIATAAGVSDVVVGTAFAGRTDPDVEDVIGFFTNTVALRTRLTGAPSLRRLVHEVRDTVLAAMDSQDVPFNRVVDALGVTWDGSVNPLFQHWFSLAEGELTEAALELPGIRCTLVATPVTTARFDTELELGFTDGALRGAFVYATDLFGDTTAQRFVTRLRRLLSQAATHPDASLSSAMMMDDAERAELLSLATPGPPSVAPARSLIEWFEERVSRDPNAVAVSDGQSTLTYRELADAAGTLAAHLTSQGVKPADIIGVYLPRCAGLVVALVAIITAGAAYLPIDTATPPELIAYQLADCRVERVLTTSALAPVVRAHGPIAIDKRTWSHGPTAASADARPRPNDLLYVIYTSGSTGTPKGVAITHGQFASLVRWHVRTCQLSAAECVAQVASVSFDAAGWEIWPALLSGARLEICPDDVVRSPDVLVGWLARHGCTIMFAPTPLAERLLRHPLSRTTSLKALLTGGDVFRPRTVDHPGVDVFNHYGPTENTVVATATAALRAPWSDNSIGRPVAGAAAHLLDDALHPVPRGMVGELFLGGTGVAWGYWRRPALTAQRFLPDPFSVVPNARLYRTGDLARWREDGTLCYVGRADSQLKVRGYRIEPREVESALLAHPVVEEAVVCAVTARSGERVLACYLVPSSPDAPLPTPAELRRFLSPRLPHYLIPEIFVRLADVPRTLSGKVDRNRLPASDVDSSPVAPRTEVERAMLCLWRDVLEIGDASVLDDFFALGGNSMTAARLLARLNHAFGVELPLRAVFDHRSLAELSEEVQRRIVADIAEMSQEQIETELAGDARGRGHD